MSRTINTIDTAIAAVCAEHAETLAIDAADITVDRAHRAVSKTGTLTTTELLLLLAALHADPDCEDQTGAEMLARFAAEFATHEATVV